MADATHRRKRHVHRKLLQAVEVSGSCRIGGAATKLTIDSHGSIRLHWLSTWKAELKNLVATAQSTVEASGSNPSNSQPNSFGSSVLPKIDSPSKTRSKVKDERVIFHCDFDAFFVSVGRLGRDDLEGKPVVVCHSTGGGVGAASTSEIASPSYEARDFGIKAGMR